MILYTSDPSEACRKILRRHGARPLRHPSLQLVFDAAVAEVGMRRRFAIFLGRHVAVDLQHVAVGVQEVDAFGHTVIDRVVNDDAVLLKSPVGILQFGEAAELKRNMLHPDALGVRHPRSLFCLSDGEHMVVVRHVGAEKEHTAVVLADLRETQNLGEKFARAFEILYSQYQMADASDSKPHGKVLLSVTPCLVTKLVYSLHRKCW